MTTFIQIIFWAVIPAAIIYYRYKKKINTSSAIFGVLTSFVVGLLLIGTFMEMPRESFIKFMNQNKIEEAKRELRIILQKNPGDIRLIDKEEIINLDEFERMKKELEAEYLSIIKAAPGRYRVDEGTECTNIESRKACLAGLENALRLLDMAESIGEERPGIRDDLTDRITKAGEIVSLLEERCK